MSTQRKTPEFVLDINSGQLWCGDDEIKLSPKAFALLRFLMAHPGCLLSKNAILDGVWQHRSVNEEVIRDCIRDLRKALGDKHNAPRFIETVHKRGYRYIGAIKMRNPTPTDDDDPADEKPSIAVLPFDNLSGDSNNNLLANGITDSLITTLAMTPTFRIAARHSSDVWRGQKASTKKIAEELKVRYIITGSVKCFGTHTRVSVQLCDGYSGYHQWAKEYAYTEQGWLQLQDEFSWQVATELEVLLIYGEMARDWRHRTLNPEAYRYFLRAKQLIEFYDPIPMGQAQDLLKKSVALDQTFASAWVELANTYHQQARLSFVDEPSAAWAQAQKYFQQALTIDNTDVRADFMLAAVDNYQGKLSQGLQRMEKNIANNSNHWDNIADFAVHLCYSGRAQQALSYCEQSFKFIPQHLPWIYFGKALPLLLLGDYEQALAAFQQSAPRDGARSMARSGLAYTYVCLGRMDDARAEIMFLLSFQPGWNAAKFINGAPFEDPTQAQRMVTQLRKAGLPE